MLVSAPTWAQEGLSLPILIDQTLASHPALAARQSNVDAAETGIDEAQRQFWPTPAVAVERPDRALTPGTDRSSTVVSLRQPIWTGGRLQADLAQARASMSAAQAEKQEARRDLALDVVQAYADHHAACARQQVYEASLAVHQQLLEQVQRRAREGLSASSDIALALGRMDGLQADLAYARSQRGAALQRLRMLAGQAVQVDSHAPAALAGNEPEARVLSDALAQDPGMARLRAEAQQLKAKLEAAQAAQWPQAYASLVHRKGDVTGSQTQIMLGLQANLGAGLSALSSIKAARQRYDGKQSELEARERQLSERLQTDLLMLHSARLRRQAYQQAADAAAEVGASWQRQFIAGKKAWQDVMNAERDLAQTRLQLADAGASLLLLEWRIAILSRGIDAVLAGAAAH